jgi:hypothetical protein
MIIWLSIITEPVEFDYELSPVSAVTPVDIHLLVVGAGLSIIPLLYSSISEVYIQPDITPRLLE